MIKKILLIEKDLSKQKFFKSILKECDLKILEEPQDFLHENRLDLILVNYNFIPSLPKEYFSYIPTIVMFDSEDYKLIDKAVELNIVDFILPNTKAEEILARINLQKYRQILLSQKNIDTLTGVYNKEYFLQRINDIVKQHLVQKEDLTAVMIDLDFFRDINSKYGHLAGDDILKQLGELLQKAIRPSDMLFRFGGEEFILLLERVSYKQALLVAERLNKRIKDTDFRVSSSNKIIKISASFGVAILEKSDNAISLINRADEALYKAKNLGKGAVVLD